MIVALAIVLVILSASFPLLDRFVAHWSAQNFAVEVLTAVRTARYHALTRGQRLQVRINADKETVSFLSCTRAIEHDCETGDWHTFQSITTLRADPAWVDVWAIGESGSGDPITSGIACLVYQPTGFFQNLLIDQDPGQKNCSGESAGNAVIFTTHPLPTTGSESNEHPGDFACEYRTLHFLNGSNGRVFLLPYGAYIGKGKRFFGAYSMGERPRCAGDQDA